MSNFFHRLAEPTYFGGLPGGYDYINNATSGTPANVSPQSSGGPNSGSYFVCYGEDATSANANRPNYALAQNTDYLDNLMHQDLAAPTASGQITSAGDTSWTSSTPVYVGKPGTPNTPAGILAFAKVLDMNGDEINVGGTAVAVASISGATVGTNFSSGNVTFTFNTTIPSGQTYQVWYAVRSNLANLPVDAFTNITIRTTQELPAAFEDFQAQIAQMSGVNVVGLVATLLETPDGTRLSKSGTMNFSVDPDGSQSSHIYNWYMKKNTGSSLVMMSISDVPSVTGTSGQLSRTSGLIDYYGGAWVVADTNTRGEGSAAPYSSVLNLTNSTPHGATVQKWDKVATTTDVSNGLDITLISHINARWSVTCGDGTNSFGDFNGNNAINLALTYATNHSITKGHILVKAGTYAPTSTISTPSGSNFIIEGDGGVTINSTLSAGGELISVGGGTQSFLDLRNLTVAYASGSIHTGIDFSSGALAMSGVTVTNLDITAFAPTSAANPAGFAFKAVNCSFTPHTSVMAIQIASSYSGFVSNADGVQGVIFEDCILNGTTDNPIFLMKTFSGFTGVGSLAGLLFNRCQIYPSYATTNGSNLNGNSGVIAVDPSGMTNGSSSTDSFGYTSYANIIFLRDASWVDCRVSAVANNGSNQSDILMHLTPFTNNTASPTSFAAIGTIRIKGGRWEVGNGDGTHTQTFSPFFLSCRNAIIEDVVFGGSYNGGSGVGTADAMATLMGTNGGTTSWTDSGSSTTPASKLWGAFTIAPGAGWIFDPQSQQSQHLNAGVIRTQPGCTIRNVIIQHLARGSGCGDLLLAPSPTGNNVDGIRIQDYNVANIGLGPPGFRVWVYVLNSQKAYGDIKNIHVIGQSSGSNSLLWIDNTAAFYEHEGIFRITPGGHLHLSDCVVKGFTVNGSSLAQPAFVLAMPKSSTTAYGTTGLWLDNCHAENCDSGFSCSSASSTHPQFTFRLTECGLGSNETYGIYVSPAHVGQVNTAIIAGCSVDNAPGDGIHIAGAWQSVSNSDLLMVTGTSMFLCGGYGMNYVPSAEPAGLFFGNNCGSDAVRAEPNGSSIANTTPMSGFETGTGSSTSARTYTSLAHMLFNTGLLST